ncbi:MAG: N-acetyl-gamma-glutamyl-phosphate reductase [Anaeromyxobacteraceae bacterium]
MNEHAVAVVGASGYTGLELTRLLARHPRVKVTSLHSDKWAGERAGDRLPLGGDLARLAYSTLEEAAAADADLVFLATPAEASAHLAPKLLSRGKRVVDLSGAFRLADPADYPRWYGFEHPAPSLLAEARYGLPEFARDRLAGATLVTNPGCYATAIACAIAPLVRSGLVATEGIVVTALSGVSGAGRKATEDYSFVEVADDFRAYRIGKHQHVPEIEQTVARFAGGCGPIAFTPILAPIRRGILASVALRAVGAPAQADLTKAYAAAYAGEPFVRVVAADRVQVKDVVHTNRVHVGVTVDSRSGLALATSAIDNLVKGAAGQAVQAMNAVMGWPETDGLDLIGG